MKKGDTISKELELTKGHVILAGATSESIVKNWMNSSSQKIYKSIPPYEVAVDPNNEGCLCAMALGGFVYTVEAKVNWVVGDEASIDYGGGQCSIINLVEEPEWKVTLESAPSFQSSVAVMSEEELRGSIDALRDSRKHIPKVKVRGSKVAKSKDPIAIALAKMPKDQKEALMKKLGMTE